LKFRPNPFSAMCAALIVNSNVLPYLNMPAAERTYKEIANVKVWKERVDEYRKTEEGELLYKEYLDKNEIQFTEQNKIAIENSSVTPKMVSENLGSLLSSNSAAMGGVKMEIELSPLVRGDRKVNFPMQTSSKKMIHALSRDKTDISTIYLKTETLEEWKQELKRTGKKETERKHIALTAGVRADLSREVRLMFMIPLPGILLENVVGRNILVGATARPVYEATDLRMYANPVPGIMTNRMTNAISMMVNQLMMGSSENYIAIPTDASAFDKNSMVDEVMNKWLANLKELVRSKYANSPGFQDLAVTLDGKKVTYEQLIDRLMEFNKQSTYYIPGRWSSGIVDVNFTASGSTFTYHVNTMKNLTVQDEMGAIAMQTAQNLGCRGLVTTIYKSVSGDDASTVLKSDGGVFEEKFLDKIPDILEKTALITGYEFNANKGGLWVIEEAKICCFAGFMINHKPVALTREKESTATSSTEADSAVSVLKMLTAERTPSSNETMNFMNTIGSKRQTFTDESELYILITSALVSTLPAAYGGSGLPFAVDMNAPIITILRSFDLEDLLHLMIGVGEITKESVSSNIRKKLLNAFTAAVKGKGKGINIKHNIKGADLSSANLEGYYKPNEVMVKRSIDALSKLKKGRHRKDRVNGKDDGFSRLSYANSQERAVESLVNSIQLKIYEERAVIDAFDMNINDIKEIGAIKLGKLRKADPVFGFSKITYIEFEPFKQNYVTSFVCQNEDILNIVMHYGAKSGKTMSSDYLSPLDGILTKYAMMAKRPSVTAEAFIDKVISEDVILTEDNMRTLLIGIFGLEGKLYDGADILKILDFLNSDATYIHFSEASTSQVYISDSITESLYFDTSVSLPTAKLKMMFKQVLVLMCMIFKRAIKMCRIMFEDGYKGRLKFQTQNIDAMKQILQFQDRLT